MGIIYNSSRDCNKIIHSFIDPDFVDDYDYNPSDAARLRACPFEWGLGDDGWIYTKTIDPLAHALCMKADVWNELNCLHYRVLDCKKMHKVSSIFHKLLVFL